MTKQQKFEEKLSIMFFVIEFFFTITTYQFGNYWIFINYGLFFQGKCSLQVCCLQF